MKFRVFLIAFLLSAPLVHADEDNFFNTFQKVPMADARVIGISPVQLPAGIVTDVVVHGENFRPRNEWNLEGVRVLKERYVDSSTVILTVRAENKPGKRSLNLNDRNILSFEITAADVLLNDDFNDNDISDWNVGTGTWTAEGGQVNVTAKKAARLFPTLNDTDSITLDFDMTIDSGRYAGIFYQFRDLENYRSIYVDGKKNVIWLKDVFNGKIETKVKFPAAGITGSSHHYSIAINNGHVVFSLDGSQIFDRDLIYVYSGQIALYARKSTAHFDNIVVTHDPAADAIPIAAFSDSVLQTMASFNASGSLDPDGNIVSYDWTFGDSQFGAGVQTTHEYNNGGNYKVVLSITDNGGARTKMIQTITVAKPVSDSDEIKEVVKHFFVLLADLEFRTPEDICQDFSRDPACPSYDKQVADLHEGQPSVKYFDVEFLSDVIVNFQSANVAYPVKIRNKLLAMYFGDPNLYYTDGWHTYEVHKEADGKWHQCRYTFSLVSSNE